MSWTRRHDDKTHPISSVCNNISVTNLILLYSSLAVDYDDNQSLLFWRCIFEVFTIFYQQRLSIFAVVRPVVQDAVSGNDRI